LATAILATCTIIESVLVLLFLYTIYVIRQYTLFDAVTYNIVIHPNIVYLILLLFCYCLIPVFLFPA
ncbi:hypothetical protein, partial [Enterococcus faecium]|uniref:hypothetical protein n=1 Tax=Enterococcus faecium TaxID=1352 RepID=UPI001C68F37B